MPGIDGVQGSVLSVEAVSLCLKKNKHKNAISATHYFTNYISPESCFTLKHHREEREGDWHRDN